VTTLLLALLACRPATPPVPEVEHADLVAFGSTEAGRAISVIVAGDAIRAVVDPESATPFVGPSTTVVRAEILTAGFVDAHAHPAGLGRALSELDLRGIDTLAATVDTVRAAPGAGWITGRGWDQNDWTDAAGRWPTYADLDAVHADRPVAVRRVDGHAMWLNSAALAEVGISEDTPDPPGGRLIRDGQGRPTGVLVDTAMGLVDLPDPDATERRRRQEIAVRRMTEVGLTGAHSMGVGDETLAIWEAMDAEGALPVRLWLYLSPESEAAERLLTSGPWSGERVSVVGIKAFADGALGSRGAHLSAPYADAPDHSGTPIDSLEELTELATRLLKVDASLAVHAIGDAGVSTALDAFEAARKAVPDSAAPLRLEHAQVVHPNDVPRFAALDVVASMQPTHCTSDMPWAPARLGEERVTWAYAWRTLADAGATLAFGSDFPVEKVDPNLGVWAATRRSEPSTALPVGGWSPEQALSLTETVAAFTSGAAVAVRADDRLGKLEPGHIADLTLWNAEADGPWTPAATVVGGKLVWSDAGADAP